MSGYAEVLALLVIAVLFALVTFALSSLIRPHSPEREKLTTYECGEEPVGGAWVLFDVHFYIVALLFVLFDVEGVFLLPWAMAMGKVGLFAFVEGLVFIVILAIGLAYAWRKGALEWVS